jgi:hypothetical protein
MKQRGLYPQLLFLALLALFFAACSVGESSSTAVSPTATATVVHPHSRTQIKRAGLLAHGGLAKHDS